MRITISKQSLLESLQAVMGAVTTKNTLPILSNILFEAGNNNINITATDLDIGITHTQEANITEQGSTTIPAKRFQDIIKEFPNEEIQIATKKNNTILITAKHATYKILTTPKEEFPNIPTKQNAQTLIIDQKTFKQMLVYTVFAMSKEETRYVLNGVCIEIAPGAIQAIATDGRRLAIIKKPHKSEIKETATIIIPSKTIQEVFKTLKDDGGVEIRLTPNQVVFQINNTNIISRLIEGEYPNYKQAIPKKSDNTLVADKSLLIPAIKRASLLTTAESQAIKLHLAKNRLIISKTTPEVGEAVEDIEVVYSGSEMQIGFNPAYLLDVLKNIEEERVEIEFTGPEKPAVLRIRDEYVYIVLPMQIV
ncbi:MAG: DNA polymerase III subunit beta [Candidatus Omnitrophica bacterium]|nr:DNA polymerase III subunit beta [Candidatus Omnitrophota bacterium]